MTEQFQLLKFTHADQVVYQHDAALITSYIGGAYRFLDISSEQLTTYNFPIAELFLISLKNSLNKHHLSQKHIYLDVDDSLKKRLHLSLLQESTFTEEDKRQWFEKNSLCIEIAKNADDCTKYALMLLHLNNYCNKAFGIKGELQTRTTKCSVLTTNPGGHAESGSDAIDFAQTGVAGRSISILANTINNSTNNFLGYPVIDETNYPDLRLVEVEREIEMVAITSIT